MRISGPDNFNGSGLIWFLVPLTWFALQEKSSGRSVRNQWEAAAPKMAAHHCAVSRTGVKPETAFSWRRASKLRRCRAVFALYRMLSVCESSTRVSIEVAYVPDASQVCQFVTTPVWSALYSKAGDE